MSNMYAIKEETLTALGDAVRSKKLGTSELPVLNVDSQYISYGNAYAYELPNYVKKVQINGFVKFPYNSETFKPGVNGSQGLGVAPGAFGKNDQRVVRADENYKVVWEGYAAGSEVPTVVYFETEVESNKWAFVATVDSSSPACFHLTFTAVGFDENGNEFKYTPLEMVDKINELEIPVVEPIILTGNQSYGCAGVIGSNCIKMFGDTISTEKLTNTDHMFYRLSLERIPFSINYDNSSYSTLEYMFSNCDNLIEVPVMTNIYPSKINNMFDGCLRLREFPEGFGADWNWSYLQNNGYMGSFFYSCHSLRKAPVDIVKNMWGNQTSSLRVPMYSIFNYCYALDEVRDFPIQQSSLTSNCFSYFVNDCNHLKALTFATNEDGTPKTAKWKSQTIDLTYNIGNASTSSSYLFTRYNSGITADKEVKDDATYQALKNDPDWFSCNVNYSRYNHDSAVETINSLPDTSATGTNIIKFKGAAGALTDGGAINTLTEEEIAVAAAKGWTVTLS